MLIIKDLNKYPSIGKFCVLVKYKDIKRSSLNSCSNIVTTNGKAKMKDTNPEINKSRLLFKP